MKRRSTGHTQVFNVTFYCQHALLERKVDVKKGGDELKLHQGPLGCVLPWSPHLVFLVAQLCPTLCNPVDCSPPGSSIHGDSPGKNTGVGRHALLQRIFLTQELNSHLLYHRQILYPLSCLGSPHPFIPGRKKIMLHTTECFK